MASMIVTFPTVWAHLIGQLLYYMGSDNIVFGSDSLWYGGPQWQIDALWRFQIPDQVQDKWRYPQLDAYAKRKILGLNSARLYALNGFHAVGQPGSPYKQGHLARYETVIENSPTIESVMQGPGYPTPIVPASLLPDDNFTKMRKDYAEMGLGRSNTRFGWIRKRG